MHSLDRDDYAENGEDTNNDDDSSSAVADLKAHDRDDHNNEDDTDPDDHEMVESLSSGSDAAPLLSVEVAPSRMYTTPTYFRQTRHKRGKIFKTVTERYLRDDLGFGCYFVDGGSEQEHKSNNNNDNEEEDAEVEQKNLRRRYPHDGHVAGTPQTIETASQLLSLLQPCQPFALVVVDTNVLLHNLDVLEQAVTSTCMPNWVVPQTALQECRARQPVAYDRTVELLRSTRGALSVGTGTAATSQVQQQQQQQRKQQQRQCAIFFPDPHHAATALDDTIPTNNNAGGSTSINDANDARVRKVARYFGEHLRGSQVRVILLTDDADCRRLAACEQPKHGACYYEAKSVREWVLELEQHHPQLSLQDLLAQLGGSTNSSTTVGAANGTNSETPSNNVFDPHLESSVLLRGVQTGLYHRGVFRRGRSLRDNGVVVVRRGDERVAVTVPSDADANRAVDGDVVAIALHPLEQWLRVTAASAEPQHSSKSGGEAGIASDTAEPTQADLDNVPESLVVGNNADDKEDTTTSNWRPTGKVVGILRRNFGSHTGSIFETAKLATGDPLTPWYNNDRERIAAQYEREHDDGTTTCVFFPVDPKVPPILIRTVQRDRLLGQRIVVAMDSWPVHSPYPLGHYVKSLGLAGSKDVETQVLLQQHDIPHEPFSPAVLACLPPENYKIDAENSPGRTDLRHLPVLSIDPPNCKDIDDALHCIELPNGNYQVGVHIADVTHYMQAGCAMDLEAANRSTSTYLVNKRLDMLPGLLTTDLCSLKGNVDRYAFSVLWEVTPDAEIINVEFKKSLIHSIAALTYQQAQILIEQPDYDGSNDIQAGAVKRLARLARKFRQRRIDAGALTLASPEVKFVLDSESLNPTDVQAYSLLEANAVVEEFMLLANVTVSKKILRHYPTLSILRRHPSPNRAMFDGLISKAKSRGLTIDIEDSKRLADSLDAAIVPSDPYINKLLRILSTRCMSPAQYFCSGEFRPPEWHHYGLAAPVYTHFTSPIRRYADVCVHRLLAAAIGVAPLPPHLSSKSYLHDLAANMNRRHRSAQLAGRDSVQLHTLIFFAGDGAKEEDAYVLDIDMAEFSDPSMTVMVPRYGIEGRVMLGIASDAPGLERRVDQHKLIWHGARGEDTVSVQVFDKVRVRIWVRAFQDHHRELVIDLVVPEFVNDSTATLKRKEIIEVVSESPSSDTAAKKSRKA